MAIKITIISFMIFIFWAFHEWIEKKFKIETKKEKGFLKTNIFKGNIFSNTFYNMEFINLSKQGTNNKLMLVRNEF